MNTAQTVNSTDLRRTDLRVDDADIDDAIADAAKTQTIIDETIQAGNIPIPAVLDPASVNIMKELLDISMSGASDDVKEAKLAEIADRVDEAQMPQFMLCLSKMNETSKMLLAKEKENRKRAREESYTSPKKQNPLRLTAAAAAGVAPQAPVLVHPVAAPVAAPMEEVNQPGSSDSEDLDDEFSDGFVERTEPGSPVWSDEYSSGDESDDESDDN